MEASPLLPSRHHPRIRQAAIDAVWLDILERRLPSDEAYRAHFHTTNFREVPFLFTMEEWWNWWQPDGRWEKRGLTGNGLVMANLGDVGRHLNACPVPSVQDLAICLSGKSPAYHSERTGH